jgi:hypothetical protein
MGHLAIQRHGLHFCRRKEEAMARLPEHPQITARIILQHNSQMNLIV